MSLAYLAPFSIPLGAGDVAGIAGWAWLLIFLATSLIVALLLISNAGFSAQSPYLEGLSHGSHADTHVEAPEAAHEAAHEAAPARAEHSGQVDILSGLAEPVSAPAPVAPENLEIIEGIGPKINQILHAAGITTFAQLADTSVERLNDVLHAAGLRINDPSTWPDQARLAAAGQWAELEDLQSRLKAGRAS